MHSLLYHLYDYWSLFFLQNYRYLDLLSVLCVCNGVSIPDNQRYITEVWLTKEKSVSVKYPAPVLAIASKKIASTLIPRSRKSNILSMGHKWVLTKSPGHR